MGRRILLIAVAALAIAGCNWGKKQDDVLGTTKVMYSIEQCTKPNADGVRCDEKTCKADEHSNCAGFKDRCTQSDHRYEGNDSAGTCTRGDQVG